MGSFEEAKPLYEESLSIRRAHYGSDHPAVATALNNLGLLLKNMHLNKDAEDVLRESLQIREEAYEDDHPAIATGLNNLGMILQVSGKFKEARKRFEAALSIRKDAFGSDHPDVANTMHNIAELSVDQSRLGQARKLFEEVIRIRIHLYGEKHPAVIGTRMRLYELMRLMGLLDEFNSSKHCIDEADFSSDHMKLLSTIQEAEEDDDIVSHYLKMDEQVGIQAVEGIITRTTGHEELENAWSNDLRDRIDTEQSKLKEELGKIESNAMRIRGNVEITAQELRDAEDNIFANKHNIRRLQSAPDTYQNREAIEQLGKLAQRLQDVRAEKEREHGKAIQDLNKLEVAAMVSRKKLQRVEDLLPQLEQAHAAELACRAMVEKTTRDVAFVQEEVEYLKTRMKEGDGNNDVSLKEQLKEALAAKASLEEARDKAEEELKVSLRLLAAIKAKVTDARTDEVADDGVSAAQPKTKIRRKTQLNEEKDELNMEDVLDDLLDEEEEEGEEEEEDDQSTAGGSFKGPSSLKKKVRKQKMLISMLKSQLMATGQKPIEEVVTFAEAEEKLKGALGRLLMGDEKASEEYDKWDHFVRNHPEYKLNEDKKSGRWKRDNELLNNTALRFMRTYVPPDIITKCTLPMLESKLPKAVARRIWTKKTIWLTRIPKDHIAKLHIADLQSKYSPQGLDELELRAMWAALPEKFDNDPKGEKAAWRQDVLDLLKSRRPTLPWSNDEGENGPTKKDVEKVLNSIERNPAYK